MLLAIAAKKANPRDGQNAALARLAKEMPSVLAAYTIEFVMNPGPLEELKMFLDLSPKPWGDAIFWIITHSVFLGGNNLQRINS